MLLQKEDSLYRSLSSFLIIIGILIIAGLIFIYSASSVYALMSFGSAHYFVKKQIIGLCIGLVAMFITACIPFNILKHLSPYAFFGSLTLTAMTLVPGLGTRIHGSSRWLALGPLKFQPSELVKVSLLLYLGYFFAKKDYKITSPMQGYVPLLCIIGMTCLLLLRQPDFGLAVTLAATTCTLLFIARMPLMHLAYTIACATPVIVGLILFKPYRMKRILTYLNPWQDPQGAGFQIIQSLIAIGSGNWLGTGISHSKQKFFYLPMQHTDFIFSIIAEETGFIGASLLIMLYASLLYCGLRIAMQLHDVCAHYYTLGFVLLTSIQALINICVATGLLPTKGIGLPFVSYGNSSLVCNLIMIGIMISAIRAEE